MKYGKCLLSLFPLAALATSVEAQLQDVGPIRYPAAQDRAILGTTAYMDGRLIVRFEGTAGLDAARAVFPANLMVEKPLVAAADLYLVRILDLTPAADVIRAVSVLPGVRYAAVDHVVSERQSFPNDSSFGTQWDKHNTGQSGGTVDADIDAPEAWDLGTGSSDFAVAVIDNGFQVNHPDLIDNIYVNAAEDSGTPGVDDDGNGYVDDVNGWNAYSNNGSIPTSSHGTHVSGIVGAKGNNGIGVAGVNWDVTIVPIAGSSSVTSTVLAAYGYACDQKSLWISSGGTQGVNVVSTNSSFGIDFANCQSSPYTAWDDSYDVMGALGILSAAATANNNVDVDSVGDVPTGCSSDYLIAVTNTTRTDAKAFAGFGATTIDIGAPGSSVLSTLPGSTYGTLTGTSMATPQIAGTVAFLHSVASPALADLRNTDHAAAALVIRDLLFDNADPIAALAGITVTGARLNLHAAAQAASEYGDTPKLYVDVPPNGMPLSR